MAAPKLSDAEFLSEWQRLGSARAVAREHGIDERATHRRRERMERRGFHLPTRPAPGYEAQTPAHRIGAGWTFPREKQLEIHDGVVVVFSDAHYWPGDATVAHKALIEVIKATKPRAVIANGDVFDGGSLSRHDPFGWAERPTVKDELHACQERLGEIEQVMPKGCLWLWNIGNHCLRFERTLAIKAKDFAGLMGMRLADHFPGWEMQWSTLINPGAHIPVMVKHKNVGGIHAGYNNTLKAGYTMVTGHTHILESKPWQDYRGRRWGVQTGTLADHHGPQFEYTENAASPACSGFAVLTFKDGKLLPPELCEVIDGEAIFRGKVVA